MASSEVDQELGSLVVSGARVPASCPSTAGCRREPQPDLKVRAEPVCTPAPLFRVLRDKPSGAQARRSLRKIRCSMRLTSLALGLLAAGCLCSACASSSSAKFVVTQTAVVHYGSSTVGVGFKVHNVGTAVGQPKCTVTIVAFMSFDDSTYKGSRKVTLPSSQPGHWDKRSASNDKVLLSGPGASAVTLQDGAAKVTCGGGPR